MDLPPRSRTARTRRLLGAAASVVVLAMALVACGDDDDTTASKSTINPGAAAGAGATATVVGVPGAASDPQSRAVLDGGRDIGAANASGGAAASAPNGAQDSATSVAGGASKTDAANAAVAAASVAVDRQIARAADVTVGVTDYAQARARAVDLVDAAGGLLVSEASHTELESGGRLEFKVPPDRFDGLLGSFSGLGTLVSQTVTQEDVTEQIADVESRVASARASLDRIRALMDEAKGIDEVTRLESELATRESSLESLLAQQRSLRSRVATSTIALSLRSDVPAPGQVNTEDDEPLPGFRSGLRNGWHAFTNVGSVTLAVVGALLPFSALALAPLGIIVWLVRRRLPSMRPEA